MDGASRGTPGRSILKSKGPGGWAADEWPVGVDGGESELRSGDRLIAKALWRALKGYGFCAGELGSRWRILACF